MTLSEYRKTQSWQGAIALAPGIINLAEALPASEEFGLSFQLRRLMVELPAAIATDLLRGSDTRQASMLQLQTTVELIDRVYPALDTAATRTAIEQLAERLAATGFQEELAGTEAPAPAPAPETEPAAEPTHITVQADVHPDSF